MKRRPDTKTQETKVLLIKEIRKKYTGRTEEKLNSYSRNMDRNKRNTIKNCQRNMWNK